MSKMQWKISLGDTGIDGRKILKCIFENWNVKYSTSSGRVQLQAFVNKVMNLQVI
jgi:hypothetical protein